MHGMIAALFGGGHSCKTYHGRCIKPAGSDLTALGRQDLARGLERTGKAATANKLKQGGTKFSSAYYGDINNEIEASFSKKTKALLTAQNEAAYTFKPCSRGWR